MKFLHLVIAVVAFMAINSESKPQQPQIIVNDLEDYAPVTYHTTNHSTTVTATRVSRDAGDNFVDQVYAEHNRIRKENGLSTLRVDGDLEDILQRLGYNGDGHDHREKGNLQSYAVKVTGRSRYTNKETGEPIDYLENYAASKNGKLTAKDLLSSWMDSPGHKKTILDSRWGFMACGIGSQPSSINRGYSDYSYTCAFIRKYKDNCIENGLTAPYWTFTRYQIGPCRV